MLRLFQRVAYLVKISIEPVCRKAWKVLKASIALSNPKEEPNEDEETVKQRPNEHSPDDKP